MNFYDLDPEIQRRVSAQRFIQYLKRVVYPYHPFVRKLYKEAGVNIDRIRRPEDIRQLPFITKQDLRNDPTAFVLQPTFPGQPNQFGYETADISKSYLLRYAQQALTNRPRDFTQPLRRPNFKEKIQRRACLDWMPIHFHASTGSTGKPTPCSYTYHDFHKIMPKLASLSFIRSKNFVPGDLTYEWTDKTMNIFPGAPHLAFFSPVISKCFVGSSSFDTFGGKVIPTERQIEIFALGQFTVACAVPSYMIYWLRKAVELRDAGRIEGLPSLKAVILGAEPVSDSLVACLEELAHDLGANPKLRIIESYGSTELKWAFLECTRGSGMHMDPMHYYPELLNPDTKEPVPEGEPGVMTFSHIGWHGTVLARYYTGDLVKGGMRWERCPKCGYTFAIVKGPICRADKDFTKLKGTLIDLSELRDAVREIDGVRNFQVYLETEQTDGKFARDVMTVHVLPHPGHAHQDIEKNIRYSVKATTEVTPDRILFESDVEAFESRLFERTGVKAEHIVEKRSLTL